MKQANPCYFAEPCLCALQYIDLLRKCKMTQRLKAARRAMQALFPLSEDIWLQWLADEQSAVKTPQHVQALQQVYDLAVQDYLSVSIWESYLR